MRTAVRVLLALVLGAVLTLGPAEPTGATVTVDRWMAGASRGYQVTWTDYGVSTQIVVRYAGGANTFWMPNTMVYPNNWLIDGNPEYGIPGAIGFCWWITPDRWGVLPWASPSATEGWAYYDTLTGGIYPVGYSDISGGPLVRDWLWGLGGKPCARLLLY